MGTFGRNMAGTRAVAVYSHHKLPGLQPTCSAIEFTDRPTSRNQLVDDHRNRSPSGVRTGSPSDGSGRLSKTPLKPSRSFTLPNMGSRRRGFGTASMKRGAETGDFERYFSHRHRAESENAALSTSDNLNRVRGYDAFYSLEIKYSVQFNLCISIWSYRTLADFTLRFIA